MEARRLIQICMAVLAGAALAGCAVKPLVAEVDREKVRKVAIAVADFEPDYSMRVQTGGSDAVGKVQAAVEEEVTRHLKASDLREPMIAALRKELAGTGIAFTVMPRSGVRKRADAVPEYEPQAGDVDAVLEVSLRAVGMVGGGAANIMTRGGNELLAGLGASSQVRLIDAKDGRVIGEFRTGAGSGFTPLEDWVAARGGRIEEALAELIRRMAVATIDAALREFTPPEMPGGNDPGVGRTFSTSGDLATRDNMLLLHAPRPVSLRPDRGNPFNTRRPRYGLAGAAFTPTEAASLQPDLEWEAYPRRYPWAPESVYASRIENVTYELRLFSSVRQYVFGKPDVLYPERMFYERTGLRAPAHQPEIELAPCTVYFWTARARFTLDGRERVTPWMSAWWRGLLAFATPATPGKEGDCPYGK